MAQNIALYGGEKVKTTPFGTGKRFGQEELTELKEALEQNSLFYWYGNKVKTLTERFREMYQMPYCVAASSGTAAIHVALGACGVTVGDEVITSPITDMGTIIGILFQNAVPVFADVDPNSYNMDPKSIEERITSRTKAILVVHLTGGPADMDPIMEIAKRHNLKVIEDCAQSYLATYKGKLCGTIGDVGCFSLNDYKQISAGDGGLLITKDAGIYHAALRFADKNYQRLAEQGSLNRDIPFIAPNYRMNELTGAVGIAQLKKLPWICARRNAIGERISAAIKALPGIEPPKVYDGCKSTYWFYMFRIDEGLAGVSPAKFSEALKAEGIPNMLGYIPNCVYEYEIFRNQNGYPGSHCPFQCPKNGITYEYKTGLCPTAEDVLRTSIRLGISEFYTDEDVDAIIEAISKVSAFFAESK